ncbi:MAG: hypothetical protein RLZ86_1742 [Actinomycetota bacterium]
MRRSPIAWILALSLVVAACGGDDSSTVDETTTSESPDSTEAPTTTTAEVANPASQFCAQQGGTVEIVEEGGGQVGYCNLPDGTRIDEWEYYEANLPPDVVTAASANTIATDGQVGWYPAIAIGDDGNPIISHHDRENGDLLVTVCDDPACSSSTTSTLDSDGEVGLYTALVVDYDGRPIIAHQDRTNGDLRVTRCADAKCSSASTVVASSESRQFHRIPRGDSLQ